jgi:flagellar protein FlaD
LGEEEANGGGLTGVKELSELLGRFEEVEDKIGRIDSALTTERNENSKVRDRLTQMERDIRKLLSVYEVVSAKFNPFIDVSEKEPQQKAPSPPVTFEAAPLPELDLGEDIPEFRPYQEGEAEPPSFQEKVVRAGRDTAPWEPGTSTTPVETMQMGKKREPPPMMDKTSKDEKYEREMRAAARSKHNKKPLLAYIPHDYLTLVLVMRWIEFLFERVTRDKISLVLDYYVDVGWISEDVKSEIMSYARGEMQDVTKYMGQEEVREEVFRELPAPTAAPYKKVEDWRLSADDHLKSLLFVQKIAGLEVDKDRLNSLEQNISKFKETLEGFHGV